MLIEALKDFAFAHLIPLVVTAFVLIAAFITAFMFYPAAVPVLFKVVLMIAVATASWAILSQCSLS